MDDIYERGQSAGGKPTIIIRRKPSQVPVGIDSELMHIGTMCDMDGPNSRMEYEFLLPGGIEKAEKFLQSCGWQLSEKKG